MIFRSALQASLACAIASMTSAVAQDVAFFEAKVLPVLKARCYECHSHEKKMKGGLTLDSKSGWEDGGENGPAIMVGKPEESLIIKMVRWTDKDHQMPPKEKLPATEIVLLEEWVKLGAPDPRVLVTRPTSTDWWSLKPLVTPKLPVVAGVEHPVDRFIRARLAERKVAPSPEADRRTLIRRVMFDLHGLPPTLAEVEAFAREGDYAALVDRLLASPRYGERWARHWLDTIHFAETHGCGHDLPRDHAWRYRDYVIKSLNSDKPWPRFVREQLAADRLFPDEPQLIPALGFLGAGVFDHSAYQTAPTNFDYLDRDDLVTQTMAAFTSTTANCARCHAHKFDPITQEDYYALQSVFAGIIEGDVAFDESVSVSQQRKRWQSLLAAADAQDKAVPLTPENAALVAAWEKQQGPAVKWTMLNYESFVSTEGAALSRSREVIISSGAKPDKDTYVITAAVPLNKVTALRIDTLADKSLPMSGPGRQDNGNLTLSEIEVQLFESGAAQPVKLKFSRATADFDQQGWTSSMAIDGKAETGWGIHPAVGQSHHAVFELAQPLTLKPGAKLTISLKQLSGRSHLIGRFKLSVTDEAAAHAAAMPVLAAEALAVPAEKRSEPQRLALAAHVLRIRANEEAQKLPAPSLVYAAGKKADVLLAVSKGTPTTMAKPKVVQLLKRGEFGKPMAEVPSGALSAVNAMPSRFTSAHAGDESERRAALADWIADAKNPLTWRSIVNRVWHYHFGRGICDTPSDFGRMGGLPSHPELLDWLACQLRDSGGSLKHLHRLIVTSAAYRQSSEQRDDAAKLDGDNRLLWRMNRLRLDADSYRDHVLAAADKLDLTLGGPSVRQFVTGPAVQLTPTLDYTAYDWAAVPKHRRSIYRFVWRGVPDPFMETLDFPDLGLLAPSRSFSASSLQSLALYNNAFVLHFSDELGKQITTPADAVRRILLREPTADEIRDFTAYAQQHSLAALCRVLINSSEFLFVN
ncbi:PSD1 and planctomycete cytochrome C domain-containing protein [Prosthecobacter sp.]|uniref:PSD1 and planctomycete cytochrome C domain-containing protein n=1 Tax=Prosthecobacter sp. TaxID=1965333 RepID=UPI002AB80934|nr:PSD1 and planctomycete cytochrome C domain-containing protein [Prosthecobacter sp.]MDZ4402008.1 PSD1 and planctomycete cytochrome C domain-containing protein [Prosthecobacter sp.]